MVNNSKLTKHNRTTSNRNILRRSLQFNNETKKAEIERDTGATSQEVVK